MVFFLQWALWAQMTFALLGALVLVVSIGVIKNVYTWRRNRKYIQLPGPSRVAAAIPRDIEAQMVADFNEIPFGIRALQQGIEVEGVWISQPNTPTPGSPVISAMYSGSPSIKGGSSQISAPSEKFTPPDLPNLDLAIARLNNGKAPRIPSFALDSFHEDMVDSIEQLSEYQAEQHSSTLEALEGRNRLEANMRQYGRRSLDETRYDARRTRSEYTSTIRTGSSVRDGSPSPPALTDGASRADTPLSTDLRPHLSAYLSESNHRLSHVAETGQLAPRVRMPRNGDNLIIPALDPLTYRSTFSFTGPTPAVRLPQRASTSLNIPTITRNSFSDGMIPTIHAPKPVLAVRKPTFDLHSLHSDLSPSEVSPSTTHLRTPSGNLLIAGHQPSPILSEYMSNSFKEGTPIIRDFTARHTLHSSDVISPTPAGPSISEPAPTSDFRRVNADFEVKRGAVGSLAIPLELPPLPLEEITYAGAEKRQSRKLQKRKPRAKSLGA